MNDRQSAEEIAHWIGTQYTMSVTAQLDTAQANSQLGTLKYSKEFVVHPDELKQGLSQGDVCFSSKAGVFEYNKVRIKIAG